MAVDVRALVVIEIDLAGVHDAVAAPVVGTWSDSRTPDGWELAARLTRREFHDLAESLRFVPATAAVDGESGAELIARTTGHVPRGLFGGHDRLRGHQFGGE